MPKNVTKNDIAEIYAKNEDIAVIEAKRRIDGVLLSVLEAAEQVAQQEPDKNGVRGKITLTGFGSFTLRSIPERLYRNPQTQEPVIKEQHNDAKFEAGKTFKDMINQ